MERYIKTLAFVFLLSIPGYGEQNFSVLTLNTWLLRMPLMPESKAQINLAEDIDERIALIAEKVAETDADIVALQEVWGQEARQKLISDFTKRGYFSSAPRIRTKKVFAKLSSSKIIKALTGWLGLASDHMAKMQKEMGDGLLVFSKYRIDPDVRSMRFIKHTKIGENLTEKGAILVRVLVPGAGWTQVVNTHLGSVSYNSELKTLEPTHVKAQWHQLQQLFDWVNNSKTEEPLIVVGDFNAHPKKIVNARFSEGFTQPYWFVVNESLGENGLIDTYFSTNREFPYPMPTFDARKNPYVAKGAFGAEPSQRLDYVFCEQNERWEAVQSDLVFKKQLRKTAAKRISDHYGVLTKFKVKKSYRFVSPLVNSEDQLAMLIQK